jgi:DNA-binding sugar fermentation-stimulating protein
MECFTVQNICIGLVINRPSKTCKSPYVADVILIDHLDKNKLNRETIMVHTPSLGCGGLVSPGEHVIMTEKPKKKNGKEGICKYTIIANAAQDGSIVVTHPLYSNQIWGEILRRKYIDEYSNLEEIRAEVKEGESRFDFFGMRPGGKRCFMEVKSAPLGSIDISPENRKYTKCVGMKQKEYRVSYFPDGYRKKKGDVVSTRALKHAEHLGRLVEGGDEGVLVFIVPRRDTTGFILNPWDNIYKEAVIESRNKGVKIEIVRIGAERNGYQLVIKYDSVERFQSIEI